MKRNFNNIIISPRLAKRLLLILVLVIIFDFYIFPFPVNKGIYSFKENLLILAIIFLLLSFSLIKKLMSNNNSILVLFLNDYNSKTKLEKAKSVFYISLYLATFIDLVSKFIFYIINFKSK